MKIVRVVHDAPVGVAATVCYGPFTDEEAWTFADKVDRALFKKGLSMSAAEILNVEPPREFLSPATGAPLEIP